MPFLSLAAVALLALQGQGPPDGEKPAGPRGLLHHEEGAFDGYTMIAPLKSKSIYLVDMEGKVVHEWKAAYAPGSEYLLPDGNLLRCSHETTVQRFKGG